jgi:hypothetical protein
LSSTGRHCWKTQSKVCFPSFRRGQNDRTLLAEVENGSEARKPSISSRLEDVGKCSESVGFVNSNLIIEMKSEEVDEDQNGEPNAQNLVYYCKHVTVLSHCVESWRQTLHVDPANIAPQMHWIYKLEGKQKELICKYFLDSNKTGAEDKKIAEELKIHVFRILRYITNEKKPDQDG